MDSIKNMTRQRARSRPIDQESEESEAMSSTSQPRCSRDAPKNSQVHLFPFLFSNVNLAFISENKFSGLIKLDRQFGEARIVIQVDCSQFVCCPNEDNSVKGLDHIHTASSANSATNEGMIKVQMRKRYDCLTNTKVKFMI
ncbi:hypothetical protein COLO4_08484 [Corchorus olitorius]|uniref:Uncharacterized protein n=1 Tax=Corchorus olitorius TaxID=93759 RepID=A0A1R3KFK4_9ROSI|nr:hypothetical protein COLO4_08484 [Corchorus olitorius]